MNSRSLCDLLDVSLRQWGIAGRCEVSPVHALGVDIVFAEVTGLDQASVARLHSEGVRLPVWRFTIGARRPVEAVSIRQALKALRIELDPDFRPARAIIGVRPSVPGGGAGTGGMSGVGPSGGGDGDSSGGRVG